MIYTSATSTEVPVPTGVNYAAFVLDKVAQLPAQPLLIDPNHAQRSVRSDELGGRVRTLAGALQSELLVSEADVLLLAMANSCQFVQVTLAAALLNATSSSINHTSKPREMCHQVDNADVKFIFTDTATLATILETLQLSQKHCVKTVVVTDSDEIPPERTNDVPVMTLTQLLQQAPPSTSPRLQPGVSTVAHLPYSSGTTGLPKGVMLRHHSLLSSILIGQAAFERRLYSRLDGGRPSHDVMFVPIYHMFGYGLLMQNLISGVCTVLMPRFDMAAYFSLIQKYRPSVLPLVPPIALRLLKDTSSAAYDLSSVQLLLSGAAPLHQHIVHALLLKFTNIKHVMQGYGMTELMGFAAVGGVGRAGNCGLVAPNTNIMIVDPSTGQPCAHGEAGEIRVRSPSVMAGYFRNPQATQQAFDSQAYLRTGDVGYFDDEGFLYIVDRIKELIKVKGNQVAPAELESLLVTHPDVVDCAVVGVKADPLGEELPTAVVVSGNSKVTEAQLVLFVNERVSRHKRLTGGVRFVDHVPKSTSGKILRRQIRDHMKNQAKL